MRIDAHQHFWKFDPVRDAWITNDMKVIQKDFLPGDLFPLLTQNNITGCIAVQTDQSEKETDFLIGLAGENSFIKGVVGWTDLTSSEVESRLEHYSTFGTVKGFRHILQGEADRKFMLLPTFKRGLALLQKWNFTYDILVYPDQLPHLPEMAGNLPQQKFILDHIGKPNIREQHFDKWKSDICNLAKFDNVYCKISGMVTEADWLGWKQDDFTRYLDIVVNAFGIDRIVFGSDWPVCLLAASYNRVIEVVEKYFSGFSKNEKDKFFGENAANFYNLQD